MKSRARITVILSGLVVQIAAAQVSPKVQGTQGEPANSFWTDPSTSLMWANKDNGHDVSWKNAMKYCRELRLSGKPDWRLSSLNELKGIYDKAVGAPGGTRLGGPASGSPFTWHVKGNIFLSGNQWANDQQGHSVSSYHQYFDFNEGRSDNEPTGFFYPYNGMRALCVRGPVVGR